MLCSNGENRIQRGLLQLKPRPYSSLAMGLHGVLGAVLIPLGARILGF